MSALIDYKGFRCLAIGIVPILAAQGPSLGFIEGVYGPPGVSETGLKDAFANVGQVLKLTPNQVGSATVSNIETVPVSFFPKIYKFFMEDSKMKEHSSDAFKKSSTYHFSELEYMEEPQYVLKTSEIFPYD